MVALVPLGVLSVVQTREQLEQVDASTLKGISGIALSTVQSQIDLIEEAQISARVLASVMSQSLDDGQICIDRVNAIARDIPQATLVGYIPVSGQMTCTSTGKSFDFSSNPRFQDMLAKPEPRLVYNPNGPVSGTAVIGASYPVVDPAGTLRGFAAISLPYTSVAPDIYVDAIAQWQPTYIATFLEDGTLLLSSDPDRDPTTAIPGGLDHTQLAHMADKPAFVEDHGPRQILSVVSVTKDLFLVSVWQRKTAGALGATSGLVPYLLPALTWIAALVAANFASSRLVVRHVRTLSRSMTDYVSTRRRSRIPDVADAPTEIQRLHAAYDGMIRKIEQEEAELQNLIVDKDVLIREVNHRSGNSLQIIASIMRMYRREATDQKLRAVLDGLINRVIALSSTHTSLYSLSGERDVAIDVILSNVVKRLKEIHGVGLGVAMKRLQPIRMDPQAAVPLALALAEAVGCYFARPGLIKDAVVVDLSEADGTIRLHIEGPEVPELRAETQDGVASLPQRMLRQFAAQLFGTVSIRQVGDRASVELVFPRPAT
jgi:two-component system, sensor histidine kinase PdtaS